MTAAELLAVALSTAASGLPVFPCTADKCPCIAKTEGGRGFLDATTAPTEIKRLFAHPGARLIGVPTGERSGFDVLDFDYRHGAHDWETGHRSAIPETRTHETQSGGRHLLFQHAHGVARNSAGRIGDGIDVRGEGGYIIHPPSTDYRVISDAPIVHWPDWLLQPGLVLPPLKPQPAFSQASSTPVSSEQVQWFIDRALTRVRAAAEGQKHFTLRNMALLLGGVQQQGGFTDQEAVRWLLDALPHTVKDRKNAERTAQWGIEVGRSTPIEPPAETPREHVKALAKTAFALLRMKYPAERAAVLLQTEAARLGIPPDRASRIRQWVEMQFQRRRGGAAHG